MDPGTNTSKLIHYLRTTNPISPEVLATYQKRLPSNRSNPYPEPGRLHASSARGLPTFGSYLCANPGPATFAGAARAQPAADRQPAPAGREVRLHRRTASVSPSCREQAPLGRLVGQSGRFPQLQPIEAP